MKEFMLVVLFYLGGPEPQFADGFLPLFFDSYESVQAPPFELNCFAIQSKGDDV